MGRIVSPTGYPAWYPVSSIRCQISGKKWRNSEKQWKKAQILQNNHYFYSNHIHLINELTLYSNRDNLSKKFYDSNQPPPFRPFNLFKKSSWSLPSPISFVSINIWLHHFGLEDGLKVSLKVGLKVWELKHQCGELSSPQTLKICRIEIFNLLYPHFEYLLIAYSFNTVFERELVKSEQIVRV